MKELIKLLQNKGWTIGYISEKYATGKKGDVYLDNRRGAFIEVTPGNIKIKVTDIGFNSEGPKLKTIYDGRCGGGNEYNLICDLVDFKL